MSQTQAAPFVRSPQPNWARGKSGGYASTTKAFVMPANGSETPIFVDDSGWISVGHYVLVTIGSLIGYFEVTSVSQGVFQAKAVEYSGDAAPGSSFDAGAGVRVASRPPVGTAALSVDAIISQIPNAATAQDALSYISRSIGYNVRGFGAQGNDVADDTAAIQNAINAAGPGGTVIIPDGIFRFSTLTIPYAIRLKGCGFSNSLQAVFADPSWGNSANYSGTILRSTAAAGNAIKLGVAGTNNIFKLSDLMVIGPGAGTAVGIHLLRSVGTKVDNVLVANFATGWQMENIQDSSFSKLAAKGCSTGATVGGSITSNQNAWYNCEFQSYSVAGVDITAAAQQNFYAGLFQDGRGGYGVRIGAASSQNLVSGCWFESYSATGAIQVSGISNRVAFCNFGNATDHIHFENGADGNILMESTIQPGIPNAPGINIKAGATNTKIINSEPYAGVAGTYVDSGTGTVRQTTTGGLVNIKSGNFAFAGTESMGGVAGDAVTTTRLIKRITGFSDTLMKSVLTLTVPNSAQSAILKITVVGSLGAGGAIGANEASASKSYVVTIARTAGLSVAETTSAAFGDAATAVAGAATASVGFDASLIAGANNAQQAITVRASVTKSGGASDSHTCVIIAELMNANGSGITMA